MRWQQPPRGKCPPGGCAWTKHTEVRSGNTDRRVTLRQWLKPWGHTKAGEQERCGLTGGEGGLRIQKGRQREPASVVWFRGQVFDGQLSIVQEFPLKQVHMSSVILKTTVFLNIRNLIQFFIQKARFYRLSKCIFILIISQKFVRFYEKFVKYDKVLELCFG